MSSTGIPVVDDDNVGGLLLLLYTPDPTMDALRVEC